MSEAKELRNELAIKEMQLTFLTTAVFKLLERQGQTQVIVTREDFADQTKGIFKSVSMQLSDDKSAMKLTISQANLAGVKLS